MYFEKLDIQKLQEQPIESVAERLGIAVSRHKAVCPFHADRHPSLTFHVGRNKYRCYVCGAYGGVIDLVMNCLHKSFPEACEWLSGGCVIPSTLSKPMSVTGKPAPFDASRYSRFFEHPFLSDAARRFLFEERRIDPRVARYCRLSSFRDKGGIRWLQIPYYGPEGQLTGIQHRNLDYSPAGEAPRFRFPKGSQCGIYNLPVLRLLKEGEPLFVTEGASDCWAMLSAGHKAIAIPSATLLKERELEQIRKGSLAGKSLNLHIFPDADVPGERLCIQLKELFPRLVRHPLPEGYKDFGQWWAASGGNVHVKC